MPSSYENFLINWGYQNIVNFVPKLRIDGLKNDFWYQRTKMTSSSALRGWTRYQTAAKAKSFKPRSRQCSVFSCLRLPSQWRLSYKGWYLLNLKNIKKCFITLNITMIYMRHWSMIASSQQVSSCLTWFNCVSCFCSMFFVTMNNPGNIVLPSLHCFRLKAV